MHILLFILLFCFVLLFYSLQSLSLLARYDLQTVLHLPLSPLHLCAHFYSLTGIFPATFSHTSHESCPATLLSLSQTRTFSHLINTAHSRGCFFKSRIVSPLLLVFLSLLILFMFCYPLFYTLNILDIRKYTNFNFLVTHSHLFYVMYIFSPFYPLSF